MITSSYTDKPHDLKEVFTAVKKASRELNLVDEAIINALLTDLADAAIKHIPVLLAENKKDLDRMDPADPKYDRLQLTEQRIKDIAADILNVVKLPSPLGKVLEERTQPNGLELKKITVPLGVVGIIYEARPNVTFDVFSLCVKSGNACILKGGSDAMYSIEAIVKLIKEVVAKHGLNPSIIELLAADRSATEALLNAVGYVDVIIPRGSQSLIDHVRQNAKVPVIETGAGIVHTFFDDTGDIANGKAIIHNAKTRRVSVCNALDCLIIHKSRVNDLPRLVEQLSSDEVTIYADESAYKVLIGKYPEALLQHATPEHYGTEFLSYKMAVKTVSNLTEALEHIAQYSSGHSEAIISNNQNHIDQFFKAVDAAVVYANTSTAFTDGAHFGMGAEIGLSTQKLHARGPLALRQN